jgi:hypothetical protein
MYPIQDGETIKRYRTSPMGLHSGDAEIIFQLYKKYVNPSATVYTTNCGCSTDIRNHFYKLLEWYSQNESKFI